jgi:hypothetical protein
MPRFSEVAVTYSKNALHLQTARKLFEAEVEALIDDIKNSFNRFTTEAMDQAVPPGRDIFVRKWKRAEEQDPRDKSWLNFNRFACWQLNVKWGSQSYFKTIAGILRFECQFDKIDNNEFVVQIFFQNNNRIPELTVLDEKILEETKTDAFNKIFPSAYHLGSNTTVLFKENIGDQSLDDLSDKIQAAVCICETALSKIQPPVEASIEPKIEG